MYKLYNGYYLYCVLANMQFRLYNLRLMLVLICLSYLIVYALNNHSNIHYLVLFLHQDWATRSEDQGLLIERILVLIRNVLAVPASPDAERRADNDASLHDQVLWALQQSGVLELVLYLIGSEFEHQYHLHALEIVCQMYREQTADSLVDASLQRSRAEQQRDEQELIAVRRRERAQNVHRPPAIRHSRFGGTYVMSNVKSISNKDIICHQSLSRAIAMEYWHDKAAQRRSHRVVGETGELKRRSAFSVRQVDIGNNFSSPAKLSCPKATS